MSGRKLLLDSNIVIYISQKKLQLESFANDEDIIFISIINYIEVLGTVKTSDDEKKIIQDLLSKINIIRLEDQIVEKTIDIRQAHTVKLPDAIISASALVYDCSLVTHNKTDFDSIISAGRLIDPME